MNSFTLDVCPTPLNDDIFAPIQDVLSMWRVFDLLLAFLIETLFISRSFSEVEADRHNYAHVLVSKASAVNDAKVYINDYNQNIVLSKPETTSLKAVNYAVCHISLIHTYTLKSVMILYHDLSGFILI